MNETAKPDPTAAYAGDLLVGLRKLLTRREQAFLAYLVGMAAEEAIRLAEGLPSEGPRRPEAP